MTHQTDETEGRIYSVIEAAVHPEAAFWEITTLRTQLAAANARADRAEAALAAQIEVDAWQSIETAPRDGTWFIARTRLGTTRVVHYADRSDRYPIAHDDKAWPTAPMEWMPISIRNQAHDRSALDRMRAEAREQALRDAAEMVRGTAYTSSNVGRRLEPVSPAMAGMDMHHATIADAILALIEAPNAQL